MLLRREKTPEKKTLEKKTPEKETSGGKTSKNIRREKTPEVNFGQKSPEFLRRRSSD